MNWFSKQFMGLGETLKAKQRLRQEKVESTAKILAIKENSSVSFNLNYKCPPRDITIEYVVYGTIYTKTLCAKYIDFIQLKELVVGNRIAICYEEGNPDNAYLRDYTYRATLSM